MIEAIVGVLMTVVGLYLLTQRRYVADRVHTHLTPPQLDLRPAWLFKQHRPSKWLTLHGVTAFIILGIGIGLYLLATSVFG